MSTYYQSMLAPMARSGVGAPPEGCKCLKNMWNDGAWDNEATTLHWTIHRADPACPHHGTPPRDDLYDGRMPIDEDDDG